MPMRQMASLRAIAENRSVDVGFAMLFLRRKAQAKSPLVGAACNHRTQILPFIEIQVLRWKRRVFIFILFYFTFFSPDALRTNTLFYFVFLPLCNGKFRDSDF